MITFNKKHSIDFTKILDPHSKKWQVVCKPEGHFYRALAPIEVCKICHTVTSSVCPKCFVTNYCSTKCLNQDKSAHSQVCGKNLEYNFVKDGDGCAHYVVSHNMSQGRQILVSDVPVILPTLPKGFLEDADGPMGAFPIICFGCHKHFYPGDKREVCSGCGVIKCSVYCSAAYHSETECEILKMVFGRNFASSASSTRKYVELYLDICVLRVLRSFLHGESSAFVAERYRKFTLLSTTARFKQFTKTKKDPYDGAVYMKLLNKSVDSLHISLAYAQYNREVVQQVFKTMIVFWEQFEIVPGITSRLLFLERHFMSHSYCSSNVAVTVTFNRHKPEPTWITYTTKEINVVRDGNVRLMFDFSPYRFMPLPLRMEYLNGNGFASHCQRPNVCRLCNDSSDGGTDSGSIKCLKCPKGLYVEGQVRGKDLLFNEFPRRWSTEYVKNVDWKCRKCGDMVPFSLILEANRKFQRIYFDEIRNKFGSCPLSDISKFVNSCDRYLHPLNGVMLNAKYDFVMAAREKHLYQCGISVNGLPADPYYDEKYHMDLIPKKGHPKLRLFPVNWKLDEQKITQTRAEYATDCARYLGRIRNLGVSSIEGYTDYTFLKVERVLIQLVNKCHRFYKGADEEGEDFAYVGVNASKLIQEFNRKRVMQFGLKLSNNDPLLKWPEEMKYFGEVISQRGEPQFLARLILQSMKISVDAFVMDYSQEKKRVEESGIDSSKKLKQD